MEKKKENVTKKQVEPKKSIKKKSIKNKTTTSKVVTTKKNIKKKKKAFTLIELLAVIIILGVLMIIAIPSVTTYISNSRKNAYIDTARNIVDGARNIANEGKLGMYDTDTTYYLPAKCIKTENGLKSPYGDFTEAYVGLTFDGRGYSYYWISTDETGQGVKELTSVDQLDIDKIESNLTDTEIKENVDQTGVNGRNKILILKDDCSSWNDLILASKKLNENGEVVLLKDSLVVGDYIYLVPDLGSYTISKTYTGSLTDQTIYPNELTLWRIIKINSDGSMEAISEYSSSTEVIFRDRNGYSKLINGLKLIANSYNINGYTTDTRIFGYDRQTLSISNENALTSTTPPSTSSTGTPLSGTGREYKYGTAGDTLYLKDYQTIVNVFGTDGLKSYNVSNKNELVKYWVSSRDYYFRINNGPYARSWSFRGRYIDENGSLNASWLFMRHDDSTGYNSFSAHIRPIITLKEGLKITGGNGTKDNPCRLK